MSKLTAILMLVLVSGSFANAQKKAKSDSTSSTTFHLKKPQDTLIIPKRNGDYIMTNPLSRPIKLTLCGKDSGVVGKAALKKCIAIDIGGLSDRLNNEGDMVFAFDLSVKHGKVYMTKHSVTKELTPEMQTMLKNVIAGDSIIVKNVQYKSYNRGLQSLPAISLIVVDKDPSEQKNAKGK